MATRKPSAPTELPQPYLTITRAEASEKLSSRIREGRASIEGSISGPEQLDAAEKRLRKWRDYNVDLLRMIFSNEKIAMEYENRSSRGIYILGDSEFYEDLKDFVDDVQRHLNVLESISERLELFEERPSGQPPLPASISSKNPVAKDAVFVVHGRDDLAKALVAGTLKDLGLRPIILADQPSQGQTIIEKLEYYASEASFAVVLLTPDDVGRSNSESADRSRARQNVVLELGYFIAKLGRSKTCALYKKGIELPDMELPSDFSGVVYTLMDDAGAWKFTLAKELRAAGFKIDLNNL